MLNMIAKLFIKNHQNTQDASVRRQYGMLASAFGILLNILLFAGKYLGGMISGSIAIMADAFNNLSDAASSVITLIGFRISGKHGDDEHPFGHGRMEYITGLIVAMIIVLMGFELLKSSASRIANPEQVALNTATVIILTCSVLTKLYMWRFGRKTADIIQSSAMKAASLDSLSDACATGAVLVTGIVAHFTGWQLDAYVGILVSMLILKAGVEAAKETISPLLGNPPDPEFVKYVEEIVCSYDGVLGIHDLIVHNYGAGRIILSLHAEVPSDGDILALHDLIDTIEKRLKSELHCEAVIHMDPLSVNNEEITSMRESITALLKNNLDQRITIHDFRMVVGPTHTNVIFDAVVPHDMSKPSAEIAAEIRKLVNDESNSLFAVVTVEHPYNTRA